MKQVTLVSFYGSKPIILENLINDLLRRIQSSKLNKIFEPYQLGQIHGTIIGMEELSGFKGHYNLNLWQDLKIKAKMDYSNLFSLITTHLPMTIRFGGFNNLYKKFTSFGKIPYERSFQIKLSSGKLILIGWPHENENFSNRSLWNLRKDIEQNCNIRHKYAKGEDNDFFIVLGDLKGLDSLSVKEYEELKSESSILEESVRNNLSLKPIDIDINYKDVLIAQYEIETLPLKTTKVFSLQDNILSH
jgi:hypothetical protein